MSYQQLIVCFDLENTIIDSWNSGCPLKHKILGMHCDMSNLDIHDYGIFSFAVDHPGEKEHALVLASFMNKKINPKYVVSWDELEKLCGISSLQKWELINIYGKFNMFLKWTLQFPEYDFLLFDDALDFDRQIVIRHVKNYRQTITFIKV